MFRSYGAVGLILASALHAAGQETYKLSPREQLERPYVALFDFADPNYSSHDVKSLRSEIEREQEEQTRACETEQSRLRTELKSSRTGLKNLNSSPIDSAGAAAIRSKLHSDISTIELTLRDKKRECEHAIPARFEITRAKMRILERWPDERERTLQRISQGHARERKHGDIDDIGYRKLTENQEKDIAVGQQAVRQMSSSKLMPAEVQSPLVRQYIQRLGTRIAQKSDLKVPLHVTLLDSAEISSIGLPGGFLFVTSGLIRACDTESELAGVMSQQIAHIAARHATRTSKRSFIGKMVVPVAEVTTGLLTGGVGNAGMYYGMNYGFQGLGVLVDRTLMASNNKGQKEADQLGIQYAWNAGFDPKGFISFLDTLAKDDEYSKTEAFFMTKPALKERILDSYTELQYLLSERRLTVDSEEFRVIKERL
jgi:predicted Zn-dependent protease